MSCSLRIDALQQCVKDWVLVTSFCSADTVVDVGCDNSPAMTLGGIFELTKLVLDGLPLGGDPGIDGCIFHMDTVPNKFV